MQSRLITIGLLASFIPAAFPQSIDPNSVSLAIRKTWCNSQVAECPLICLQTAGNSMATIANSCDPTTLAYSCVCSNGLSPNATQYSETIPYFECTEYNSQCVAGCNGDATCQSACVQNNPCGAQSPIRVNTTTTSATMKATSTGAGAAASTVVYNGFGSAATTTAASSSNHSNGAAHTMLKLGEMYGLGLLAAGISFGLAILA